MLVKQKVLYFEALQWTDPLDKSLGISVTRQVWAGPRDTNFVVTEDSKRQGKKGVIISGVLKDPVTNDSLTINLNDWVIRDIESKQVYRVVGPSEFEKQFVQESPIEVITAFDNQLGEAFDQVALQSIPMNSSVAPMASIKSGLMDKLRSILNFRP